MSESIRDEELPDWAYLYGLDALPESEHTLVTEKRAAAASDAREEFDSILRSVRETMAALTASEATAPPPGLKNRLDAVLDQRAVEGQNLARAPRAESPALADSKPRAWQVDEVAKARRRRWQRRMLPVAAAAAVAVGLWIAGSEGVFDTGTGQPTVAQVMHAPDAHTGSAEVAGGNLTIATSRHNNAAVVLMSNVAPPPPGHVYQMWLGTADNMRLVGTMDAQRMPPAAGEVLTGLDAATTVTMTIEPGPGSPHPSNPPIVSVPLAP